MEQMASSVSAATITSVAEERDKLVAKSSEAFPDGPAHIIVVAMIDCVMYYHLALKMPTLKRKRTATNALSTIVGWIVTLAILGLLGAMFGSGSDNSSSSGSSSSGSSAFSICSGEYDTIKSNLYSIESQMTSYENNNNTENYNALVPQQNSLVTQLNNKATECNNLR